MCGDTHTDYSLKAITTIVGDESNPLSKNMRRMAMSRLQELGRIYEMLRLMTGRDDWRRMTEDECKALKENGVEELYALLVRRGYAQHEAYAIACGPASALKHFSLETGTHENLETGGEQQSNA